MPRAINLEATVNTLTNSLISIDLNHFFLTKFVHQYIERNSVENFHFETMNRHKLSNLPGRDITAWR